MAIRTPRGSAVVGAAITLSLVAALSGWDLENYSLRISLVSRTQGVIEQEKSHLRRLLLVDGAAIGLAILAEAMQFKLSFGLALFFSLLAVLALSQGISRRR